MFNMVKQSSFPREAHAAECALEILRLAVNCLQMAGEVVAITEPLRTFRTLVGSLSLVNELHVSLQARMVSEGFLAEFAGERACGGVHRADVSVYHVLPGEPPPTDRAACCRATAF